VSPWQRKDRYRYAGASLLVGVVIGGLVTLALGYSEGPSTAIPERSTAGAIASDQVAARPTAAPPTRPGPHRPPPNPGGGGDDDDGG
jgi:hypothetical protein